VARKHDKPARIAVEPVHCPNGAQVGTQVRQHVARVRGRKFLSPFAEISRVIGIANRRESGGLSTTTISESQYTRNRENGFGFWSFSGGFCLRPVDRLAVFGGAIVSRSPVLSRRSTSRRFGRRRELARLVIQLASFRPRHPQPGFYDGRERAAVFMRPR